MHSSMQNFLSMSGECPGHSSTSGDSPGTSRHRGNPNPADQAAPVRCPARFTVSVEGTCASMQVSSHLWKPMRENMLCLLFSALLAVVMCFHNL